MKTFLSILRGINVGGHKKVQMMDLKNLYEELNFKNVITFIQSGNVIFKNKDAKNLSNRIEQKIFERYNFAVPVIIRTTEEMQNIVNENPFLKEKEIDTSKLYVVYLDKIPSQENIDKLRNNSYEPDTFYISGKEIYVYCTNGYGETKLTNNFFENKLKVSATTRNWRTSNELTTIMKSY